MNSRRALMLIGAFALSTASLLSLGGTPATPMPLPPPAVIEERPPSPPAPVAQPKHWAVVVDGWHIELDTVAARHLPPLPEPAPESMPSLLSPYDAMIHQYACDAGLDWRFVAAVIYEESHFDPDSVSEAGAYGLMQVMPAAAREVGAASFREPEANIRTGISYLQRLEREYGVARDPDRHALMLAAYNMGPAHLQDAQALARRFGYDPWRWDGAMDVMVSLLEEPNIAPRLPNGFAHGRSVVDYVDRVRRRYAFYKRDLPPELPAHRAQSASAG